MEKLDSEKGDNKGVAVHEEMKKQPEAVGGSTSV